ncbi:MAG: ABC transporter ATP-binding protein [Dehalococcoidia bacterium]
MNPSRCSVSSLLEVRNLSITIRPPHSPALPIVRDISFSVERGQVLAVLGESGSGKSMTIKSILRLLPSSSHVSGEAVLSGKNLFTLSEREMAGLRGDRIAMIFQDPMSSLDPVFPVGDQICEALRRHRSLNKSEAWQHAVASLGSLGIARPEERMADYPHQLSGGMCQRVMIAMALACSPDLLLADEPTSALDVTGQAQILNLLDELRRDSGLGLVLVTHDVGVAAALADEVAVMYAGELVEYGPVEEVLRRPRHPYTAGLIRANVGSAHRGPLRPISGQPPEPASLPPGCAFSPRCSHIAQRCTEQCPVLQQLVDVRARHGVRCLRVQEEGLQLEQEELLLAAV